MNPSPNGTTVLSTKVNWEMSVSFDCDTESLQSKIELLPSK